MFVNGKEILKFKADNKNVNFPTQFCFVSISNGFSATESTEVSLNGNVHDFSVDYNCIDKSNIFNIHKYLGTNNQFNLSFNSTLQSFNDISSDCQKLLRYFNDK